MYFWVSNTSGNWEDPSRWALSEHGTWNGITPAPGLGSSCKFNYFYPGDCKINFNLSISGLYVDDLNTNNASGYYGRFNFNGKNFTADEAYINAAASIIGLEGTTWTIGRFIMLGGTSHFYNLGSVPVRPYRDLRLTSPWYVNVASIGPAPSGILEEQWFHFFHGCDLRHVNSVRGSLPFPPWDDHYEGLTAYHCDDSGLNPLVRFVPIGDPVTAAGEIVGRAFLEGDIELYGVMKFRVDGEMVGKAFLEGDLTINEYIDQTYGEIDGKAFLEGDVSLTEPLILEFISGEIVGRAFLDGNIRATVPLGVNNPYVSGTAGGFRCGYSSIGPFDYLNQNKFKLTVGNTIVDFSTPYWQVGELSVDYNGKLLTFTEIATPHYARPSFNNEAFVKLEMDLGQGLLPYFRGKIKTRSPHGENHKEQIQYTAFGQQNLAAEIDDYGPQGITDDSFQGPWPVSVVVRKIFENNTYNLNFHGIPATIGAPDENTFTTWTIEELTLKNSQLLSGLTQALKTEPAKRIFFDDLQGDNGKWCFPDLSTTNFVDLDIDLVNMDPNDFTVDTKNRWTALKVYVPYQLPLEVPQEGYIEMEAGWDVNYEADWTVRKGAGLDGAIALGDAYRWVFRRWTFETGNIRTETGGPITALILVPYWGTTKWMPIQGDLDLQNGVFISKVPIVCGGNPNISGKAFGPLSAALIYIDTELSALPAIAWWRVPASGFTGTAYDWFGIAREKQLIMEPNAFTTQSLQQFTERKLEVLKDVILTTEIPIVGDPIPELINLQAQVIIKNSARSLESVPGFLSKYTYTFGKPGKSILSLSTDRALVTRVD